MTTDVKLSLQLERLHEELQRRYGSRSLYDALGVRREASEDDIKKAFRTKALKYHPDRNKAPGAEQRFKDVRAIYDILSVKERKTAYDAWLKPAGWQQETASPNYHSRASSPENLDTLVAHFRERIDIDLARMQEQLRKERIRIDEELRATTARMEEMLRNLRF